VLGLQIPVFNGFARQYDVRSAQATYDAGLAHVTSTERAVALSVWTAYYALQTATKRVRTAATLLAAAQESADVAEGRYREGVGTIIDVLLGRRDLAAARAESIQSRWEWRTALVQLGHDLGTLDHRGRPNLPPGME
jgi:outer membrane protein TolC